MFDVGFSELMVIAVVALVVIGPERMPAFARTAGALFGRAQRYVNKVKAEIQNEVDMEEFNRIKSTFYDAAKSVEQSVNQAKREIDATAASLNASIAAPARAVAAASAETPAADTAAASARIAAEIPDASVQKDFWLDSTPVAAAAAAPVEASRV